MYSETSKLLVLPEVVDQRRSFRSSLAMQATCFIFFSIMVVLTLRDEISATIFPTKKFYITVTTKDAQVYFLKVENKSIVATDRFPRIMSSRFDFISHGTGEIFMRDSTGAWLSIGETGNLITTSNKKIATLFQWICMEDCQGERPKGQLMVSEVSKLDVAYDWNIRTSIKSQSNDLSLPFFTLEPIPKILGVNLGSWFIPEVWMVPTFYANTSLGWGGSLCALVNLSRPMAEERIIEHLSSWITETDFQDISNAGLNSVRIPVGYWNVIQDPYAMFVPNNVSRSLYFLDWAFEMAEKYNITIVLDLHGGAGSQNCQDHSGCGYNILQYPRWTEPANINISLEAIEAMVLRYGNRSSLWGIELLNEPALRIEDVHHDLLLKYYENAYRIIRTHSNTVVVIFNELYDIYYESWKFELQEPNYFNVVMDLHLYDNMGSDLYENSLQHLHHVHAWSAVIEKNAQSHPIIIGEWSMSMGVVSPLNQVFVNETIISYRSALGWYVWTWKLELNPAYNQWNLQLQLQQKNGLRLFSNLS